MKDNIYILTQLMGLYVNTQDYSTRIILKKSIEQVYQLVMGEINNSPLTDEEITIGKGDGFNQGKIACIKAVRTRLGIGLKEAKDLCEATFRSMNIRFNNGKYE